MALCPQVTQRNMSSKMYQAVVSRGCCLYRYIVLETRKDGTKFTNRGLKDAAERLNAAAAKYEALQKDLVAQVMGGNKVHRGGEGVAVTALVGLWFAAGVELCLCAACLVWRMPVSHSGVALL